MSSSIYDPKSLQKLKAKAKADALDKVIEGINRLLLLDHRTFSQTYICNCVHDVEYPAEELMQQLRGRCEAAGWNVVLSEDFTAITLSEKAK